MVGVFLEVREAFVVGFSFGYALTTSFRIIRITVNWFCREGQDTQKTVRMEYQHPTMDGQFPSYTIKRGSSAG